jgi:hypothetical protein
MLQLLLCSKSTLYRLRKEGIVPHRKIRGRCYYPKNYYTDEILRQIRMDQDGYKRLIIKQILFKSLVFYACAVSVRPR